MVSEQSNQLYGMDASQSGYFDHVVVLEKFLADESAEAELHTTQHKVDKDLHNFVRTDFALHKGALQQRVAADDKDYEQLLADKAAMNTEL